ncbi:MAG: hypothetical protein P4L77_10770 [Sulfuriferula sp.]|nr:hypothetical protein [Sulfuriferula sp.]
MTNVFTPSEVQLTNLLNITNLPPKLFDATRLTYGPASSVAGDGFDTQVTATAIPGMGYYGEQVVSYTRINLNVLEAQVNLYSLSGFTLASIVSMLNAQFDTFLDVVDLVPATIPELSAGQSEVVHLAADPASIGWQGSVDITITYGKPQMNAVIGQKSLNTLKWADYPYRSGLEMPWNTDFTSMRDSLKPTLYGTGQYAYYGFADYETLSDICTKLGFPWFPPPNWQEQVGDYATTSPQAAGSNTAFDRVVIYGPIQSGFFNYWNGFNGYFYFHYNNFDKA